MTAPAPAWFTHREPDEPVSDYVTRLLLSYAATARRHRVPELEGLMPVPASVTARQAETARMLDARCLPPGTPLPFRTPGTSPVLPRGCGTRHDGECTSEHPFTDRSYR